MEGESYHNLYYWHPQYIDALAMRWSGTYGIGKHVFLQDANYNVTAAVTTSGTVAERYNYTPYGAVTFLDANFAVDADQISDIGNQHLYTGRERDPETGLQLNRHRYYASHLGRWLTRDPIGYHGGSMNLYEYVNSMPSRFVDPLGLMQPGSPGKAKCGKCPMEREYDPKTQCCEGNVVVNKITYWVCNRPLGGRPGLGGWNPIHHKYVCCDGPHKGCYGHTDNDLLAGEPIPPTSSYRVWKSSFRRR